MGVDPATMTMEATMVYLRELVLATHVELAEMLEHLPWKPWKPLHVQTADMDEAIKELADVFIFLGNIVNLLGANHDIKACILHKVMEVNFTRLKEGEHVSRGEKGEETYVKSEAYKKHLSERREKGRERKGKEGEREGSGT